MNRDPALRKDLTPEEFGLFRDWIHAHSGIFLEESKMDSLRISLVTRATRFDFTDYRPYFDLLSRDEEEFKELMNLVTINETSFFRFPAQFDAFRDVVIPQLIESRPKDADKHFRVWSAGCSTGEEPYTIAMTLLDSALETLGYTSSVLGTDVSTQALNRAREAVYPPRSTTGVSKQVLQRWFEAVKSGHRPIERVRRLCDFHYHNLIKEPYPPAFMSNWDVIFCRNVTIYFRLESTKRVVSNFYDALNPGGYLFIGHSETLTSVSDRFEPVEIGGVFLYRKPMTKRGFTFDDIVAKRESGRPSRSRNRTGGASEAAEPAPTPRPRLYRRAKEEAIAQPAAAAKDVAESAAEIVIQAHASLERAQPAEALELADKALDKDPTNLEAQLVVAFAHADLGNLDTAVEQANKILKANPLAAPARYILGIIRQQQGDLDGALREFKRTLYTDRDFVLAHFAVANIQKQRGNLAEAKREYENTLRSLLAKPEGTWTAFLGGFKADLLIKTCERGLIECGRGPAGR
jgi:chemotaxis protein methyltransferase CheR